MSSQGVPDDEQREAYRRAALEAALESGEERAGEAFKSQGSSMYLYRGADELRVGIINVCGRLTSHAAVWSCWDSGVTVSHGVSAGV